MKKQFTKAESLLFLKKKLGNSINIPRFIFFRKKDFFKNENLFNKKIKVFFKNKKIILRSSSKNEDLISGSNAGKFKSFGNLKVFEKMKILSRPVKS